MKKKKSIIAILCSCIVAPIVSGCGASTDDQTTSTGTTNVSSDDAAVEIMKNENLAINTQKCVGCGKCARMVPQNFAMNTDSHKAEVISQEITSRALVARAVENCPTHAITQ